MRTFRLLLLLCLAACASSRPAALSTGDVAPGIHLIGGRFVAGEQPDGNSVIISAPRGLIVVDSGRHTEHTQQIIDFARVRRRPVVAIVNTHWHLDHVGGNPMLRRAFPSARVLASSAIDDAMSGFLANYRRQLSEVIAASKDASEKQKYEKEIAIIDSGRLLFPDEVISATTEREVAGRRLLIGLAQRAVTAGDVWLFDAPTRTLVSGDLVTLPAPLFDTACAPRWVAALDELTGIDFATLIPGHGAPMDHAGFEIYRNAFASLLSCGASDASAEVCIDGWLREAAPLIAPGDEKLARTLLDYYVTQVLRAPAQKRAELCGR